MRGAPHHAGSRTAFAHVNTGEEVDKVDVKPPVTLGEVSSLPLILDPVTAGRLLGMSRSSTYRHLQAGTFPVPARRVGRSWQIPTAGILAHLGIDLTTLSGCCGCGARHDEHQEANHGRA